MCNDSNYENECKRCNVEKWEKALRIAEIRKAQKCNYDEAEWIYDREKRYEENKKAKNETNSKNTYFPNRY